MATVRPSREDLEQRARQIFREIFAEQAFEKSGEWWTDSTVDHFLALGISVTGRAGLERFFRELVASVSDLHMEVEHVVASPKTREVVVQWRMTGTTTGAPFQGIAVSGKRVDLRGCDVITLDDDNRVLSNTVYYDGAEFARQLGLLPKRHSLADRAMLSAFNAADGLKRRLSGG
jgi:steroid delta-isomerase-like uncharacterized protein